jgi:hypothetical protein
MQGRSAGRPGDPNEEAMQRKFQECRGLQNFKKPERHKYRCTYNQQPVNDQNRKKR